MSFSFYYEFFLFGYEYNEYQSYLYNPNLKKLNLNMHCSYQIL